jgi:hypothetical protein
MLRKDTYLDRNGQPIALTALDDKERKLVARLRRRARTHPDWNDFDTYWLRQVAAFYDARGLSRTSSRQTVPYRIAQDLSSRLALASGLVQPADYRDELKQLIQSKFPTRRAFCEATGLSEDLLSHVLARRKNLSLETLMMALERIGYRLHIVPALARKRTG